MTFPDVLALTGLSLIGLTWWIFLAALSSNTKKVVEALEKKPKQRLGIRLATNIIFLTSVLMIVTPWILMLISVSQRILGA